MAPEDATTSGFTTTELRLLLALTALPVVLTSFFLRSLAAAGALPTLERAAGPSLLAFIGYAIANWVTFGVVLRIAGWSRLRAHGLRFGVTTRRFGSAVIGFALGLGVYGGVTSLLKAVGLPTVGGMDFEIRGMADLGILTVCVVATAPFCEEVFFRVLWIGALGRRIPKWQAAAASLAAFAAIHFPYFGIGGVVFITLWAVLPTTLFIVQEDLTAPLTMHVMNNAFAYLIVPLFLR